MANWFWPIFILTTFLSCSSHGPKSRPSSGGTAPYHAFRDKTRAFFVPKIKSIPFNEAQVRRPIGRGLASVKPKQNSDLFNVPKSNKRLYFVTLYGQYKKLKSFLPPSELQHISEVKHCPSFHTSFLNHKETFVHSETQKRIKTTPSFLQEIRNPKSSSAHFPELNLPFSSTKLTRWGPQRGSLPKLGEILQNPVQTKRFGGANAVIAKALALYVREVRDELEELCESGSSQSHYIYVNLSAHLKGQENFSPSNKNMDILLKSRLFSNWALIQSFSQRAESVKDSGPSRLPASSPLMPSHKPNPSHVYQEALVQRHGLEWVKRYFERVAKPNY